MYCLLLLNMNRYIIIKKVEGSKHPELIRDIIECLNSLYNSETEIKYSNVEKFYMIHICMPGMLGNLVDALCFSSYNSVRERFSSERVYEEYKVRIYYFDQLFTIEFEDLNVPYWSLIDVARSEPIFLPTYNPNSIHSINERGEAERQEWRNLSF